jgi:mannose-6-phosphate isomerase-like protein (cupin superfamily)
VLIDLSEDDFVLGVRREKLSKKPCVIVNCFEDVQETTLHGGLVGRMASKKMPDLKAHMYLGWQTLPAGVELPGHWHDIEEIWVIMDGEATWTDCDGSQRKIKRGDFIYVTPNGYHAVKNTGQKPLEYILIKSPIPLQLPPYTSEFFEPIERYTAKAKPLKEIVKTKNPD